VQNPYEVLGISPSATDDEITQAYRKLAKKYHPDINPGDKNAEQKMRTVNAAYEEIHRGKTGGTNYEQTDGSYGPQRQEEQYRGNDPFGGFDFGFGGFEDFFGGSWKSEREREDPLLARTRLFIQNGQYTDALRQLEEINERGASWYYYSALANAGAGNRVLALNHSGVAAKMEPDNMQYRQLYAQFQRGSFAYREAGENRGFSMQNLGGTVLRILLAQIFCMFCCRPC
jgi:molecular chaperone DnaJ